jgi:hypothetical protein
MRTAIILLSTFLLFTSEKCSEKQSDKYLYGEDDAVEMSKTVCFGSCPVYNISIKGNGAARYEGIRFVKKEGNFGKKFSAQETNALFNAFEKSDFWSFQDEYTEEVTDLPTTFLTFRHKGKEKKIRMYFGYPEELETLAGYVAKMAESEGWTATEK